MSVEIERKFLVGAEPPGGLGVGGEHLRQGYLAEDGSTTVRVRITERRSTLTVKAGRGRERTEVDVEIPRDEAEALWPHTVGRRIDKVRHRVPLDDGSVAELDVYAGALHGLRTVEVEFATTEHAERFTPPSWFGPELTDVPGWTNAELSRAAAPPPPPPG